MRAHREPNVQTEEGDVHQCLLPGMQSQSSTIRDESSRLGDTSELRMDEDKKFTI